MEFYIILRIIYWTVLIFSIIRGTVTLVRTYIKARNEGIIKVCINPISAVISIFIVALLLAVMCYFFHQAGLARSSEEEWKQLRGTEYADWYKDYYNEHYSNGATQITDFNKYVEQQVLYFSSHADRAAYSAALMASLALDSLLIGLLRIFYITPTGCVNSVMKKSGEVTASVINGRIRLYLKESPDSTTPLISFKFTAENMALLGRFIERKEESEDKADDNKGENEKIVSIQSVVGNKDGGFCAEIRKATPDDLPLLEELYENARKLMTQSGNPNQWGNGHPPVEDLIRDCDNGNSYIVAEDGEIVGAFAFIVGEDPTYRVIEGSWLNNEEYGTIHRAASNGAAKGVMSLIIDYCKDIVPNIKIDTHADNKIMRHILEKQGFTECGVIYVADGTPRIAYQKKF